MDVGSLQVLGAGSHGMLHVISLACVRTGTEPPSLMLVRGHCPLRFHQLADMAVDAAVASGRCAGPWSAMLGYDGLVAQRRTGPSAEHRLLCCLIGAMYLADLPGGGQGQSGKPPVLPATLEGSKGARDLAASVLRGLSDSEIGSIEASASLCAEALTPLRRAATTLKAAWAVHCFRHDRGVILVSGDAAVMAVSGEEVHDTLSRDPAVIDYTGDVPSPCMPFASWRITTAQSNARRRVAARLAAAVAIRKAGQDIRVCTLSCALMDDLRGTEDHDGR